MAYPSSPVYLEKSVSGKYNRVYINAVSVERDLNNNLNKIPIPVTKNNQNTSSPTTRVLDLKRITDVITIAGTIEAQNTTKVGTQGVPNVDLTATEAADLLISGILYTSGNITLAWRGFPGGTSTVLADKVKISDTSKRADKSAGGIERFDVSMTLTKGTIW